FIRFAPLGFVVFRSANRYILRFHPPSPHIRIRRRQTGRLCLFVFRRPHIRRANKFLSYVQEINGSTASYAVLSSSKRDRPIQPMIRSPFAIYVLTRSPFDPSL